MPNPKPGAHKPRYYLTTFPPCLEGKTLPRAGDRRREFLPQVSCFAEEHFQRFPFFFFSFPGVSAGDGKQRGNREVRITPLHPRLNSFRSAPGFASGCPVSGWLWEQARSSKGGGSTPFFWGNPSSFRRGAAQPGPPAPLLSRSLPRPGSRGIPRAAPAELYRGRRQGGGCHPPRVRESATLAPKKLLSAAILVLVEFSCFFFFFPSVEAGGRGGAEIGAAEPSTERGLTLV